MSAPPPASAFAGRVIRWQKRHGRHDLPWQRGSDPYRIWLAEIMLQQTQVTTVIPYYRRFLKRFPDLGALAAASLDDVLAQWSGLGYYSRARNLHRAAQQIVAHHRGRFPSDFETVLALPGVGRSTAAAICAFAFGERRAILDGNVKRVFARCFGVKGWPGAPRVENKLWALAESLLPRRGIEAYTQGLMDLGATVCTRSRPRCDVCPLRAACIALKRDKLAEFPAPRPRKALPHRRARMLVLLRGGEVLLEKRAPSGIWGGLWSLPEAPPDEDVVALCRLRYGADIAPPLLLPTVAHGFSHFHFDIEPARCTVTRLTPAAGEPGTLWLPVEDALDAAIPAPVRRILSAL
ncbi:MAG TPA: A/G-specific adenine glycosylase [Burkholderiales bacterium]|nr:A/G-specific adenine glycosylase [Burkholderiales bacterium]